VQRAKDPLAAIPRQKDQAYEPNSEGDQQGTFDEIRGGESLRDAMAKTRARWRVPDSFVGQVEAGEFAGQLPAMLDRIATLYRHDVQLRVRVLTAMVLPLGVLALGYLTAFGEVLAMRMIIGMAEALML
jgi:type II secretory pathway component PulF